MEFECTAGDMRHKVTIQSPTVTADSLGQEVTTWTDVATRFWARVRQSGSRELWRAQQAKPDIGFEVTMRWFEGVDSKYQLIWHDGNTNRTLAIEGPPINPDGRKRWLLMFCREAN